MAQSRTYRTNALVIDKTKLGETDLILTFLAEDGRQLRAVGKGARKPGSRLAARCELGCVVDLLLARGRNLDIVSEANLVEAPLGSSISYELLSAASAVLEMARFCCFPDAEDPFVFAITLRALEILGGTAGTLDSAHQDLIIAAYAFKVLSHLGYRPDLSNCVLCGDERVSFFSTTAGGLLCGSCASSVAGAEAVDDAMVGWLRALMSLRFDELARAPIDAAHAAHLLDLAHAWGTTHLDARLRAFEFMQGTTL